MRVLVIDDDQELCQLLELCLSQENYQVKTVFDGKQGLEISKKEHFDLIILDVMLPNLNGFEVLRELRKNIFVPILMLTAKEHESDKVSGLRLGADDYLTKPFSIYELMARVDSLIHRATQFNQTDEKEMDILVLANLIVEAKLHQISLAEQHLDLTELEYQLLYYFILHPNQVFTKQQLYQQVWQEDYLSSDNHMMTYISRVRQKLAKADSQHQYIENVWGVGYRFKAKEE